mmetsp:Transcript_19789/g.42552  ORF Transcript_19789/g.42552 Transcript_19789/m.42552 type:complete len:524 (-) Transcript_19789:59-1630(-)
MLSGIKTGKRKRPAATAKPAGDVGVASQPQPSAAASHQDASYATAAVGASASASNQSAADALRASLLSSPTYTPSSENDSTDWKLDGIQSRINARASSHKSNEASINNLESRGRISHDTIAAHKDDGTIVIGSTSASATQQQTNDNNALRYNTKGKLSKHAHTQLRQQTDASLTIEEMAAQERSSSSNNMDEIYARNIQRMGKGYKKYDKTSNNNSRSGADEEDYLQESSILSDLYRSGEDKLSAKEIEHREKSKQIARHDALGKWTAKSWWWMESPSFEKRYLISLGEKVSMVMVPSHKCLQQRKGWGGQCFLVPLQYSESFVGVDEEVWYEVQRFQHCLRQMFHKEGRGVLFLETVTRTSRGGGGGAALQAKMEIVPVPMSVERDAPLYFKSALAEMAQEWGTHGKKGCVTLDGSKKTLRNAVPKGFPYFYCGWEGGGFVQLIEQEEGGDDDGNGGGGLRGLSGGDSRGFRDFGIDTIAGMMELDPIRFQKKQPAKDGDRAVILAFCDKWKEFDWTLELDG